MTSTLTSRAPRTEAGDRPPRRGNAVGLFALLGVLIATIVVTAVLLLSNSSPNRTRTETVPTQTGTVPQPRIGIGDFRVPAVPTPPAQCVPTRIVHAC
jgi:hypothetical protein